MPMTNKLRTWPRADGSRRRATINNIDAASRKRMRLVVAGPKLSLANLYAGRLPPKNSTIASSVTRTITDGGSVDCGTTTSVVVSLIATPSTIFVAATARLP